MVNKLTILKVLEPFLTKPDEKLHLAHISKELGEPHPTARLWLNMLEKKNILKKEHRGRQTLYSINRDNSSIIEYLAISEKNKLIERCEKELLMKELVSMLRENSCRNIIIFGSAPESIKKANDIDIIAIDGTIAKEKIEKRLNKKLHLINSDSLSKISEILRQEVIKKHLIIRGSEEIIEWMIWNRSNGANPSQKG